MSNMCVGLRKNTRKYDGETPEGVSCSFAYSSRAGNDPFLAQRTINTCFKWRKVLAPPFSVISYNTPLILPSHLLRTSSYMNFFRIQCDFILYKKTQTLFFFIFSFILILFHCFYLNFFFHYHFFSCSGMFRNVPCSWFYRRPCKLACGTTKRPCSSK